MIGANLIVLALLGQPAEPPRDPAALLEKLNSARNAEREAMKSLEGLGSKALPALRAAGRSKDPEVRAQARALLNAIEGNLLIRETPVRLDFEGASLDEVVKSISQQAGFEVGLGRGHGGPDGGSRRITLREPGPVPFWEAIDRLCEVGKLAAESQNMAPQQPGVPQPGLVLAYHPDPSIRPSSNHGAFHFSILSLSYRSEVVFQSGRAMAAPFRPDTRGIAGVAEEDGVRPAGDRAPAAARKAVVSPSRTAQFHVQMWVAPEPRMTLGGAARLELLEAVDELGHSLMPTAGDEGRFSTPTGLMGTAVLGGRMATLNIQLHRPEAPGKLIKTLRGTAEVSVSAPRPNPMVIPLEGAAGKTFQDDDRRVVVKSIHADPASQQEVIELTIDDVDGLLSEGPIDGRGFGGRPPMTGRGFRNFGGTPSQWPIRILTTTGQDVHFQTSIDRDTGRVTLRMTRLAQVADAREIRISSVTRATAKVPFEFHDLPMP